MPTDLKQLYNLPEELWAKFAKVKILLSDVDGVLTDGGVYMDGQTEFKRFNVLDGLGIRMLKESGIEVALVSARPSPATTARAKQLKIEFVSQEPGDKIAFAEKILRQTGLSWEDTCYIGDDIVDMNVFLKTPLSIAPQNAHPVVRPMVNYITQRAGGEGAVREVAELILLAQNRWESHEILQRCKGK